MKNIFNMMGNVYEKDEVFKRIMNKVFYFIMKYEDSFDATVEKSVDCEDFKEFVKKHHDDFKNGTYDEKDSDKSTMLESDKLSLDGMHILFMLDGSNIIKMDGFYVNTALCQLFSIGQTIYQDVYSILAHKIDKLFTKNEDEFKIELEFSNAVASFQLMAYKDLNTVCPYSEFEVAKFNHHYVEAFGQPENVTDMVVCDPTKLRVNNSPQLISELTDALNDAEGGFINVLGKKSQMPYFDKYFNDEDVIDYDKINMLIGRAFQKTTPLRKLFESFTAFKKMFDEKYFTMNMDDIYNDFAAQLYSDEQTEENNQRAFFAFAREFFNILVKQKLETFIMSFLMIQRISYSIASIYEGTDIKRLYSFLR